MYSEEVFRLLLIYFVYKRRLMLLRRGSADHYYNFVYKDLRILRRGSCDLYYRFVYRCFILPPKRELPFHSEEDPEIHIVHVLCADAFITSEEGTFVHFGL